MVHHCVSVSINKPVKAAHIKGTLLYSIGLCTPCVGRGFKNNKVFFSYIYDDVSEVNARYMTFPLDIPRRLTCKQGHPTTECF